MIPCLRTDGGKPLWSMGHLDAFPLPLCPISSHCLVPRRVKALGGLQEEDVCPQVLEACASPPFSLPSMSYSSYLLENGPHSGFFTPSKWAALATPRACG